MKVSELIALLEKDGWVQVRMKGSHRQFHHSTKPGTVTVAGKPHFLSPACFSALLSVPGGMSTLGFPATVTVPGFVE